MHNDVKHCFVDSNVHCGSCSHERIQYGIVFPGSGKFNGSNADICSDVAGPLSSGLGYLFELSDRSRSRTFTISHTNSTTGYHLGFECDYNSHTPHTHS